MQAGAVVIIKSNHRTIRDVLRVFQMCRLLCYRKCGKIKVNDSVGFTQVLLFECSEIYVFAIFGGGSRFVLKGHVSHYDIGFF